MGYGVVLCAVPCFVTVGDKRVGVGQRSRYGIPYTPYTYFVQHWQQL